MGRYRNRVQDVPLNERADFLEGLGFTVFHDTQLEQQLLVQEELDDAVWHACQYVCLDDTMLHLVKAVQIDAWLQRSRTYTDEDGHGIRARTRGEAREFHHVGFHPV